MRSPLFWQLHHTITRKIEEGEGQPDRDPSSFTVGNSVLQKLIEIDRLLDSEGINLTAGDLLPIPEKICLQHLKKPRASLGQQPAKELVEQQVETNGD